MTTTPNFDRLQTLANFMHNLTPEQVNLDTWMCSLGGSCGSIGCLLGWACTIPEFKEAGLHLSSDNWPSYTSPSSELFLERDAGREFFHLNNNPNDPEAWLFGAEGMCGWDGDLNHRATDHQRAMNRLRRIFEKYGRTLELS